MVILTVSYVELNMKNIIINSHAHIAYNFMCNTISSVDFDKVSGVVYYFYSKIKV